jgi:hypothetical protein
MIASRFGNMPTESVPVDLAVEALVRVVRPDLLPESFGEAGEGEVVGPGGVEVVVRVGQLSIDVVQEPVELGGDRLRVGLVIDRRSAASL